FRKGPCFRERRYTFELPPRSRRGGSRNHVRQPCRVRRVHRKLRGRGRPDRDAKRRHSVAVVWRILFSRPSFSNPLTAAFASLTRGLSRIGPCTVQAPRCLFIPVPGRSRGYV